MTSKTAILIHSKDCYRETAVRCLNALWNQAGFCDLYDMYISTENTSILDSLKEGWSPATPILTGDGLWSERLQTALNVIPNDNVIFLLEDMIIKHIDVMTAHRVVTLHEDYGADVTKFGNHSYFRTTETGLKIGEYSVMRQFMQPYMLSHQPASIWNRKFFLETLQTPVTPWQHEIEINEELAAGKFGKRTFIVVGTPNIAERPVGSDYGEIIQYHHELSKGQPIQYIGQFLNDEVDNL